MQTAMQQLIEELLYHLAYDDDLTDESRHTLEKVVDKCKGKLEMEKRQIIDAGNSCALKAILHRDKINQMLTLDEINDFIEKDNSITHGEEHYNETYRSKGSDKEEQKKLITEIMNDDAKDGLYNEINWGGVVQHIPNICNCHQSNCHLINGKYICASCNKTLNVEIQPITSSQTEISDEEIAKQGFLHSYANELPDENAISFIQGIEWYREQLKKKQ